MEDYKPDAVDQSNHTTSTMLSSTKVVDDASDREWKKYSTYVLEVDPSEDDKAKEIVFGDVSRPHMRAFHISWMSFFMAFFIWFAIAPLLGEIRNTLDLTDQQIWESSIASVGGTIFLRLMMGPICDRYGSRIPMGLTLCLTAIPTACTGLVNSARGLLILRFFIGLAGSAFVMNQFWTSRMFAKECVGSANAISAGWGNLGGGVTQIMMGSVLFPLFKTGMSSEMAWRTVCIVPAALGFGMGIMCLFFADDAPKGNYSEMKRHGTIKSIKVGSSFSEGATDFNSWVLFVQYACCFGVELTMNNAAALYFIDKFEMSTEQAGALASLFGWMNLFARGLGGFTSDTCNEKYGMRGRIACQAVCLVLQGLMVIAFAHTNRLSYSILVLVIFSIFVQAAEGTTFSIVPYVNPPATGSIVGIVGAGGNVGAVAFGFLFRSLGYYNAFITMGLVVIASSITCTLLFIKGHRGLLCGVDSPAVYEGRRRAKAEQEAEAASSYA